MLYSVNIRERHESQMATSRRLAFPHSKDEFQDEAVVLRMFNTAFQAFSVTQCLQEQTIQRTTTLKSAVTLHHFCNTDVDLILFTG